MSIFRKVLILLTGAAGFLLALNSCFQVSDNVTVNPESPPLPVVEPPFKAEKAEKTIPEFKVLDVSEGENPVFKSGNKRLAVREQNDWRQKVVYRFDRPSHFTIIIDNKQAMQAFFVGNVVKLKNYGHPFDPESKGKLSHELNNKSITFTKKYTYAPGKTAVYTHKLKLLEDGSIKVSWDLGLAEDTLKSFKKYSFYFVPKIYLSSRYVKSGLNYNGNPVKFITLKQFEQTKKDPKHKPVEIASGKGGTVSVAPGNPLESFQFIFPEKYPVKILEGYNKYKAENHQLLISLGNCVSSPKGSFEVNLGKSAAWGEKAKPPARGTDNWNIDRSHIPLSPVRNIMPNPSFEQGMRYWRSFSFGANNRKKEEPGKPLYEIVPKGVFGKKCLKVNSGKVPINTFSIPVEKGKTYTVSFYAKSLADKNNRFQFSARSAIQAGDWFDKKRKIQRVDVSGEWKRYSYQYKATTKAMALVLRAWRPLLIDGIQIEEGSKATEFTAPPVEGDLLTSENDCQLNLGQKLNARFRLFGKDGKKGKLRLNVFNYYRENIFSLTKDFTIDKDGETTIPLNLTGKMTGKGIFIVQAEYSVPGYEKYFDYYRFSVLDYLKNQHATKNFFGNIVDFTRSTRSDKKARLFMRWGWGGLGSGPYTPIEYNKKYNFRRFYTHITRKYSAHYSKPPFPWYGIWRSWDGYTPERAKKLEEITYEAVKELPDYKYLETAVSGEVDGRQKMLLAGKYDDYIKLMLAARKGAKRARKDIVFLPDSGTSFFRPIRGYKEAEAMLKSTAKVAPKGFKWDALATHPYGDVDMLDERAAHFKKIAAKYGHEDVPLQFIECFNITDLYLPSWKANTWGDTYWNGRPTYDTGWAEYRQAAWASRIYIVCLKHWPRLEFVNIWRSKPYVDEQLTPLMLCGAVNNLGHLFASPKFKADIRPVDGIRCYVFEDHKKRGLAAVWTTVSEVDRGYREPARLKIELKGERPEIIDIMGNKRSYEVVNGETVLPLTSAPLFIRGADADKITEIFSDAKVIGSNMAVKAMILPQLEGQIKAEIFNRTTQALEGEIKVDGKTRHFKIDKIPGKVDVVLKKADNKTRPGVMYSWNKKLQISLSNGGKSEEEAGLKYFYAPRTDKTLPLDPFAPEWDKIPAVKLDNVVLSKKMNSRATKDSGREGDSSASYQVAWDKNNLYLKVNYEDDELLGPAKKWLDYPAVKRNQTLYMNDAALEVYIDTAADGRSNPRKWYDEDDYRYDFYGNGPEGIYRRQEVNQQLAGGVDFLSKKEAARTIRHKFVRKDNKAWYVIIFPQVTIEPFALMPGKQAGFGIFVHDFDTNDRHGLSNSTENGEHCNYRPDRWPVIVLEK